MVSYMQKIILNDDINEKLSSIQSNHSFKKEIGGILIGEYDASEGCMRLTDMSFPYTGDLQSVFRFFRKSKGHQELMDQLWEESGHTKAYLGEWHTHPQDIPIPSGVDRRNWKQISKRNCNFDESYFIIIGRKALIMWAVMNDDIVEIYRSTSNGK